MFCKKGKPLLSYIFIVQAAIQVPMVSFPSRNNLYHFKWYQRHAAVSQNNSKKAIKTCYGIALIWYVIGIIYLRISLLLFTAKRIFSYVRFFDGRDDELNRNMQKFTLTTTVILYCIRLPRTNYRNDSILIFSNFDWGNVEYPISWRSLFYILIPLPQKIHFRKKRK